MDIPSCNPCHDGAVAHLCDGHLVSSVEAVVDSNYRYTPRSSHDLVDAFGLQDQVPDAGCTGCRWPREARPTGLHSHVGSRGVARDEISVDRRSLIGKLVSFFSSYHEWSHLLCGFGMSSSPQGSSCYALVWEGASGAFYEIDPDMNITWIADLMNEPGNRYALIYGLAVRHSRITPRSLDGAEEAESMDFLLASRHIRLDRYDRHEPSAYYIVGTDDTGFRNFAGICATGFSRPSTVLRRRTCARVCRWSSPEVAA